MSSEKKRYYWLKFHKDFFKSLRIKKLRKLAGGDTFTIIYLKLQLLALSTDGYLQYKGIFDSFEEEMAEEIEEDIDNIRITIQYLISCGLMEQSDDEYFMPYVAENTGSETASTIRSRECRARKALQCNTVATPLQQNCSVEKEIEKEKELEIDKEIDNNGAKSKRFVPPTLKEVSDYCIERNNNIDPQTFIDFYESKGWMVGKNKMKDWKASVRTWERGRNSKPEQSKTDEWLKMWEDA